MELLKPKIILDWLNWVIIKNSLISKLFVKNLISVNSLIVMNETKDVKHDLLKVSSSGAIFKITSTGIYIALPTIFPSEISSLEPFF